MNYLARLKIAWAKTATWNKLMVILTGVLALSSCFYTYYARKQFRIMNEQLTEIRKGGADTHELAVQAGKQATNTEKLANAAGKQANAATMASDTAVHTLNENKRQFQETLQQMKDQSRAMKESADSQIAANRAWLVPEFPPQHKRTIEEAFLEWHNVGKTPATNVFNWKEYFQSAIFPSKMSTCDQMVNTVKKQLPSLRQYKAFVAESGNYEVALTQVPSWPGMQPISIHGCIWYTDIASNTEKSVEFFYMAIQNKYSSSPSDDVSVFYPSHLPFVYK